MPWLRVEQLETKHVGVYRLTDDERNGIELGLGQMRERRFASDEAIAAVFRRARNAGEDAFALIEQDDSEDYGEDRFILIGRVLGGVLTVVYTERNGRIRIISAREASDYERRNYYRAAKEE
jgi:uncharacterized DUF497 family protein